MLKYSPVVQLCNKKNSMERKKNEVINFDAQNIYYSAQGKLVGSKTDLVFLIPVNDGASKC